MDIFEALGIKEEDIQEVDSSGNSVGEDLTEQPGTLTPADLKEMVGPGLRSGTDISSPTSGPKKKSGYNKVQYSVACTLHIGGSDYDVQLLPENPDWDKGYRLSKKGDKKGSVYDVIHLEGELLCDCHDFKYRREGLDSQGCKHIRALVDMGMFYRQPTTPTSPPNHMALD